MRFSTHPAIIVLGGPLLAVCLLSYCCACKSSSLLKLRYIALKAARTFLSCWFWRPLWTKAVVFPGIDLDLAMHAFDLEVSKRKAYF